MDNLELRKKVIETCLFLREHGYVFGTWGNISVRLDDGNILITPSKVDYAEMKPEDLPVLAPDGSVVSGTRLSTSEREIHRRIMNQRPDVGAIIHTHSPNAMACCALDSAIPVFSEEMCQLLGGEIPISKRFVPSDSHVELGKVASESIGDHNALLLRNHGPVCVGRNLQEALVCCQIVEKTAQIYLNLLQSGQKINFLDEETVKRGRDYFLNSYGRS